MNPTSQLKLILWGYVVAFPNNVPFIGTGKGPQSFAKVKIKINVSIYVKVFASPYFFSYLIIITEFFLLYSYLDKMCPRHSMFHWLGNFFEETHAG